MPSGRARSATLPFVFVDSSDVIGSGQVQTTTEERHGLFRLVDEALVVQWRVQREVSTIGAEVRTDVQREPVREVRVPIRAIGGARLRSRWRLFGRRWEVVITAADLAAFDPLMGSAGLQLPHPAELVVPVRRADVEQAAEFASELSLAVADAAVADAALAAGEALAALPGLPARDGASARPAGEHGAALPAPATVRASAPGSSPGR